MKRLLTLLLILFPVVASGQLLWERTTINYGTINEDDGKATCVFFFRNAGEKKAEIQRIVTSCGCTAVETTHQTVKPGARDSLTVTYNPVGRPGSFNKMIRVAATDSIYELHIIGNVIPSAVTVKNRFPVSCGRLQLSDGILALGEVRRGARKSVRFSGCNISSDTVVLRMENLPTAATYGIYPDTVAPGNVFSAAITFTAADSLDYGFHRFKPALAAGDSRHGLDMPLTITAPAGALLPEAPQCRINTDRVEFRDYGRREHTAAEIIVENPGQSPLIIKGIASDDAAISAVTELPATVCPGESCRLRLKLDRDKEQNRILNNILIIYTNEPQQPNREVRLVGTK